LKGLVEKMSGLGAPSIIAEKSCKDVRKKFEKSSKCVRKKSQAWMHRASIKKSKPLMLGASSPAIISRMINSENIPGLDASRNNVKKSSSWTFAMVLVMHYA